MWAPVDAYSSWNLIFFAHPWKARVSLRDGARTVTFFFLFPWIFWEDATTIFLFIPLELFIYFSLCFFLKNGNCNTPLISTHVH